MHNNVLLVEHTYPSGQRRFFGEEAIVQPGRITFNSQRTMKKLARNLSETFGKCTLEWSNASSEGTVRYDRGNKVYEEFIAGS